ncbi:MAG: hypothetical protein U0805_16255 [Pirellulales bacterium]
MTKDTRLKRDLHAFDEHGMVLCNPRDKEAAHRAEMEGIATYDATAVTCLKCVTLLHRLQRDQHSSKSSMTLRNSSPESEDVAASAAETVPTSPQEPSLDVGGRSDSSEPPAVSGFRRIRDIGSVVAEIRPGDGIDPREERLARLRSDARRKPDLSSERLGSQIFDALCLSSLLTKIGLEDFTFIGVTSTGRRGQFLVDVCCADPDATFEPREIEGLLQENRGLFRAEVAQSVNRRKAPELQFRVLPPGCKP